MKEAVINTTITDHIETLLRLGFDITIATDENLSGSKVGKVYIIFKNDRILFDEFKEIAIKALEKIDKPSINF